MGTHEKKSGNDQEFSVTDDFVQFSLFLKGQRSTENDPLNRQKMQISDLKGHESAANAPIYAPLTGFQMHLLKLMREHPDISYDKMADSTNKDRSTVMRNISKLKEAGIVKRVGSKKTGHWEVIEP